MLAIRQHILGKNKGEREVRPKSAGIGTLSNVCLLENARQKHEVEANTPKGARPVDSLTIARGLRSGYSYITNGGSRSTANPAVCGRGGMPDSRTPRHAQRRYSCEIVQVCTSSHLQLCNPSHRERSDRVLSYTSAGYAILFFRIPKRFLLYYSYARGQGSHLNVSRVESCPHP